MDTCDDCGNDATCRGNTALNPRSQELADRRRCDDHCDHLSICVPIGSPVPPPEQDD